MPQGINSCASNQRLYKEKTNQWTTATYHILSNLLSPDRPRRTTPDTGPFSKASHLLPVPAHFKMRHGHSALSADLINILMSLDWNKKTVTHTQHFIFHFSSSPECQSGGCLCLCLLWDQPFHRFVCVQLDRTLCWTITSEAHSHWTWLSSPGERLLRVTWPDIHCILLWIPSLHHLTLQQCSKAHYHEKRHSFISEYRHNQEIKCQPIVHRLRTIWQAKWRWMVQMHLHHGWFKQGPALNR